jgi:mono/diheme cytochrome c family protein
MVRTVAAASMCMWLTMSLAHLRAQESKTVWDGVYTADQAKRGQALYVQHCGACHGASLMGAEAAPALTGLEFGANWNGLSLGDLFERIRTSMPSDDPGKASAQQKADILAYMLRVGEFPQGATELPRDQQILIGIKYLSTRP